MTRRKLLWSGAASAAAAIGYPLVVEPRWLDITHTKVRLASLQRGSVRILQLTDLHASWAVPLTLIEDAIATGIAQKPDLICLTGDFITHKEDFDERAYASILFKLSSFRPTYAVLGNHDGGFWAKSRSGFENSQVVRRLLETAGIEVLHNRMQHLSIHGQQITLAGVGDLWAREIDADLAFASSVSGTPTVLLSHNPDSKDYFRDFPWDLMLCGHTHGGQVILPFDGPRYAPVADTRFVAGLRPWEGRQIYVSRGVGSIGGVRLGCRPEVTILDLIPANRA